MKIYDQYYMFAIAKELITYDDIWEIPKPKSAYNVLVMGIDNLSRLNFLRTMPKTYTYLKDNGAIELLGYNKVGDNSLPNIAALLLGHHESELKKMCHPVKHTNFDDCPFIWHWYKEAGYYTAFGEDSSYLGTFNYFEYGFRKMPTDYYLHPYFVEAENYAAENMVFSSYLCMGEHYFYKILLEYIENLTITLEDKKYFGFFWETTMSHDDLNYPMVMDDSYVQFFKSLESKNKLDTTIIFLISDHGMRWGPIRSTEQGRLEERLPFVYFLAPESFRNNYSLAFNNLRYNALRLTTPFDMHETLLDLIDLENIENESIEKRSREDYENNRGISLFLPISGNRTCRSASIADHWCTCHRGKQIPNWSDVAVSAASNLIQQLNALLQKYPQCARLEIEKIVGASEIISETLKTNESDWQDFLVVVTTKPGGGMFEATLRFDKKTWTLTGTASRLNLYGEQSHCVQDAHVKLYCYCK
ncbi:uncharacterized protein LOC126368314 [Pectinophora gossypiella]|uniref:uncharacterized protein LOC126368314 n=1 Tax=Pectinophora gossypiella TaxID=13191 RepID=UPI00214EA883|nr:uncharacterized protein LOC126368314 [Pectinophora gossypiella]